MTPDELEQLGGFESVFASLPPELQADKAERSTLAGMVRKLSKESLIRRTAERILRDTAGEPHAVGALRAAVVEKSGFRWRERIVGAWCLGLTQIPDRDQRREVIESLGVLADNKIENDNRGAFWRLQWRTLLVTFPLYLIFGGVQSFIADISLGSLLAVAARNVGLSLLMFPFSNMLERRRLNLSRAAALLSLGRMAAPNATGLVAASIYDSSGEGSGEVKKAAERALPAVLGALEPSHFGLVRKASVDHLCRILQDKRTHLVLAVLEALEKVGGGSAVAPVTRLLKRTRARDVHLTASRILPVLEARLREEQAPQVLLRATASPASDEDVLLRPHEIRKDIDSSALLRPAEDRTLDDVPLDARTGP